MSTSKLGCNLPQSIFVGDVLTNNAGLQFEVIEYKSSTKRTGGIKVRFLNTGYEMWCGGSEIKRGELRDPYTPAVCGVGYLGTGEFSTSVNNKKTREYMLWHNMLKRCYEHNHPTYEAAVVDPMWHNFQNFARWAKCQVGFEDTHAGKFFALDKDLLGQDSKVYSPSTCCFLPSTINTLLIGKRADSKRPCGVFFRRGVYITMHCGINGRKYTRKHSTAVDASKAYKAEKLAKLKDAAEEFKPRISDNAYNALVNFNIDERKIYN